MRYVIVVMFLMALTLESCMQKGNEKNSKELIQQMLSAINKNDTQNFLYLIDTNYYFSVRSKEQLVCDFSKAHNYFKRKSNLIDGGIQVRILPLHLKEYTIRFARDRDKIVADSSLDIVLTFPEYKDGRQMQLIEFKWYKSDSIIPVSLPDSQQKE